MEGRPFKQRSKGEAPQALLPCLGAPSRPEDSDSPGRQDTAAGAQEPEAALWAGPVIIKMSSLSRNIPSFLYIKIIFEVIIIISSVFPNEE